MQTTATEKGQIVIPAALRRKLGIKKGTVIHLFEERGRIVLQPVTSGFVRSLRGSLKGSGIFEEFQASRKREREL